MKWTAERIKKLRKNTGKTQKEFAESLGLSRYQTIIQLEKGRTSPSPQTRMLLGILEKQYLESLKPGILDEEEEDEEEAAIGLLM